ncbi:MAG: permease [Chloroflexota bacterium]
MSSNAITFITLCAVLSMVSIALDRKKTLEGVKRGWRMFRNVLLPFLNILILISVVLYFVPPSVISHYLGANSGVLGFSIAALVGSITLIPGFISYPIAAGLIQQGASYAVVATFMTTLMMVGVVTLPLEIRYFGKRVAIARNALNFVAAVITGLLVGLVL